MADWRSFFEKNTNIHKCFALLSRPCNGNRSTNRLGAQRSDCHFDRLEYRGLSVTVPPNMLQLIATGDHKLMRRVNRWPAPKWIRLWAIAATRAGDGWLWYLVGLALLMFGPETRFTAVAAAGSAALAGIGAFKALKHVSGRTRPCHL